MRYHLEYLNYLKHENKMYEIRIRMNTYCNNDIYVLEYFLLSDCYINLSLCMLTL